MSDDLLIKYICHVAIAEGVNFALDVNLCPAGMGDLEFTEDEKKVLADEIFPRVRMALSGDTWTNPAANI